MENERYEQKLVAILYADVAGYSRLTSEDEAGTHRALSSSLDLFSKTIARHRGSVVHYAGDAILAEFGMASDALTCAINVQQKLRDWGKELPEDRQIRFRIGVNLGEVIVDRDDIYGEGVNIAARLEGLAEPGGVCVSEAVRNAVGGKLPLEYEFMGEQEVKNIDEPVRAYHARLASGATLRTPSAPRRTRPNWLRIAGLAAVVILIVVGSLTRFEPWELKEEPASVEQMAFPLPDKPSIAVLPFENMSDDTEQEYFSDGITEDVITDLSKLSGLFVIARNSTFTYKGKPVKIRQVAEELGVRYVLEGSVRRSGEQVRVTAQLIDATTGGHIWAERYDGTLTDVFALQDDVTKKIVTALAVSMTDTEHGPEIRHDTESADAYDAFLQGWAHYQLRTSAGHAEAVPYFQDAIRLDADYYRAHAALATVYWDAWRNRWTKSLGIPSFRARKLAMQHFDEAMKEPSTLVLSLSSRMKASSKQYEVAVSEAERAVELDSNDATAHAALADALILAQRPEEGAARIRTAMRLDPHYPPTYLVTLGAAEFGMERFDEAVATLDRAVKRNPDSDKAWIYLAASYGYLGRSERGQSTLETYNDNRAEAGLHELGIKSLDLTRFGPKTEQDRLRAGLANVPPAKWRELVSRHPSGSGYIVEGATKIDALTAKTMHDRGVRFVDNRSPRLFARGHIPNAANLDGDAIAESQLAAIVGQDDEVVFYCDGINCPQSVRVSAKALIWGYKRVHWFEGGWPAWARAGYPVEVEE